MLRGGKVHAHIGTSFQLKAASIFPEPNVELVQQNMNVDYGKIYHINCSIVNNSKC